MGGKLQEDYSAVLTIPAGTYAGAAQILFIMERLRQKEHDTQFHSFNCAPQPTIIEARTVLADRLSSWWMHPGDLIKVEIMPDFGWLDLLIAAFIPKMYTWFDPSNNWKFVGGLSDRFYKGPHVLIVRVWPQNTNRQVFCAFGSGLCDDTGSGI